MVVRRADSTIMTVTISSGGFHPSVVEVGVGATVTWTNEDELRHTVSSAEMESGELEPGAGWSFTFDRPGRFRYFCMFHPRSVGEVTVR